MEEVIFSYFDYEEDKEKFIVDLGDYMDSTKSSSKIEEARKFGSLKDCLDYIDNNDDEEDAYDVFYFNFYYIQDNKIIKKISKNEIMKNY